MCAIGVCAPCASSFTAAPGPGPGPGAGSARLWRPGRGPPPSPWPLLRQMDAEHRAAVRRVVRRDAAAVQLDDAPRDRQPEPGPVRARGEERVEDAVAVLGGQAGAVVA